uniref:Uncharacterized protein n=1 Tax=Peronospora matthiolae TaxID=2874970 RepID=A0AAV1VLT1_9STRA
MASAAFFTRGMMVEQIVTPDLLFDEKAAKAHEAAQRKAKVVARAAGESARLRNVEVRRKLAVAERDRQQAAKANAWAKAAI